MVNHRQALLQLGINSDLLVTAKNDVEVSVATNFYRLGMVLSARGETTEAGAVFRTSLCYWEAQNKAHLTGFLYACLAQQALWMREFKPAL